MTSFIKHLIVALALIVSMPFAALAQEGLSGANLSAPAAGKHAVLVFTPATGSIVFVRGLSSSGANARAVVIDAATAITFDAPGAVPLTEQLDAGAASTSVSGTVATANLPAGTRMYLSGGFPFGNAGGLLIPEGKKLLVFGDAATAANYVIYFSESVPE